MRASWLPALLLILPAPALAQEFYGECLGENPGEAVKVKCGREYLAEMEYRMAEAMKKALADIPAAGRPALQAEQRAWNAYKDKSCNWLLSVPVTGMGRQLRCRAERVSVRADYLETLHSLMRD